MIIKRIKKRSNQVKFKDVYDMNVESFNELWSTSLHWGCYYGSEECIFFF